MRLRKERLQARANAEQIKRKEWCCMTYEEMLASDKPFLLTEDVAELLGCKAYSINAQAQQDPAKLGFPVCVTGSRVRIPRLGFLHWMTYGITRLMQNDEQNRLKYEE